MNVTDLIQAASNGQAGKPPEAAQYSLPRSVVRYFIGQPVHLRTGEPLAGSIPFVFTRECLNHRPMQATSIVPGKGWCNVAEITSAEWLRVTLAQKAHDDSQRDGGAPAALIPDQPLLPSGGIAVDPVPAPVRAPKKLTGLAARVAAGMAK